MSTSKPVMRKMLVIAALSLLFMSPAAGGYICGDTNNDGVGPNVVDVTFFIDYLFLGGPAPVNLDAFNVNGVGVVNIADLTYLVAYLFSDGPSPLCPVELTHREVPGFCLSEYAAKDGFFSESFSSGCKQGVEKDGASTPQKKMFVQMVGMDLHVYHFNAFYQCCLGYAVDFEVDGNAITAVESDTGIQCYCYCNFDLEAVLHGLDPETPRTYVVTLIGIEGDTVGIDSVNIGGTGEFRVDVFGNTLYLNHLNAYYQCCLNYEVQYSVWDGVITAQEMDLGDLCDCYCWFNLQSVLEDVPDGDYTVVLLGIEGDTVGVRSVHVGLVPELIYWNVPPCDSADYFQLSWSWDAWMLYFEHRDAEYNCAAQLEVTFERAADTLRVFEWNRNPDIPVPCLCYFDLTATAGPVAPGTYVCEVWKQEHPDSPIALVERQLKTF